MNSLKETDKLFLDLENQDDKIRYPVFKKLLAITEKEVPWIYDKWFGLVDKLSSANSFQRIIGMKLLANLCISDYESRIYTIIDQLLGLTEDEKFITARQCLQNIWKAAVNKSDLVSKVTRHLERMYYENKHLNTHGNLIKQDSFQSIIEIYKHTKNKEVLSVIINIFETETDEKIKKVLKKMLP